MREQLKKRYKCSKPKTGIFIEGDLENYIRQFYRRAIIEPRPQRYYRNDWIAWRED